jgi:hypothetical protein
VREEQHGIWADSGCFRANLGEYKIAVVCSARSTGKKVEGTTSR